MASAPLRNSEQERITIVNVAISFWVVRCVNESHWLKNGGVGGGSLIGDTPNINLLLTDARIWF